MKKRMTSAHMRVAAAVLAVTAGLCLASCTGGDGLTIEKILTESGSPAIEDFLETEEIVSSMDLSDKVYQMFLVTPESLVTASPVVAAGEQTDKGLQEKPVGGIIYFSQNLVDRDQTKKMIAKSQEYSDIPLFTAVDEEGGRVARASSNPSMQIDRKPPMADIGKTKDPERAYDISTDIGRDINELGFNMDFAPVADVLDEDASDEIGDRSFGKDEDLVSSMVPRAVEGLQESGVSAVLKHFPGHGSVRTDSHEGRAESSRTLAQLREKDFRPFEAGMDAGAHFVLVSHMTAEKATGDDVPASLSETVVDGWLRKYLGFKGIVITDALNMGAITETGGPGGAAVRAVKAGNDMLLMPEDLEAAHDAVMKAVEEGSIKESRIDESVKRIILLKKRKELF